MNLVPINDWRSRYMLIRSKCGAVVRAQASHQCGPGSNPGINAICGLSLLLVLSILRFSSPLLGNHFQNPIRSGTQATII